VRQTLSDVAALPPMQREAMLMSAVDGRSHEEVADALGITHGAVRGLLYRARSTLRDAAAALIPQPLVSWAAGYASRGAPTAERLAQLSAQGGGVGAGGMLVRGAAMTVTTRSPSPGWCRHGPIARHGGVAGDRSLRSTHRHIAPVDEQWHASRDRFGPDLPDFPPPRLLHGWPTGAGAREQRAGSCRFRRPAQRFKSAPLSRCGRDRGLEHRLLARRLATNDHACAAPQRGQRRNAPSGGWIRPRRRL
jgi:hypothetical protein